MRLEVVVENPRNEAQFDDHQQHCEGDAGKCYRQANFVVKQVAASKRWHGPFRLSDSETECRADHRRRATGIAPLRSSGIEREARGSSECGGYQTRFSPSTGSADCLCLNRLRKKSQTASEVPTRARAPNSIAQFLSGFENPLPGLKVRGYTRASVFPQCLKPQSQRRNPRPAANLRVCLVFR